MGKIVFLLFNLLILLKPLTLAQIRSPDKIKLKAMAEESINISFVVDEKDLRKLNEIIKKRISEKSENYILEYVVTFSDNSYYETENFDLIFQEENEKNRKITSIEMDARASSYPKDEKNAKKKYSQLLEDLRFTILNRAPRIHLTLSSGIKIYPSLGIISKLTSKSQLRYSIKGADRDWVFITQSDILEKFHNLIQRDYKIPYILGIFIALVSFLLISFLILNPLRNQYDKKKKQKNPNHPRTSIYAYVNDEDDPDVSKTKSFVITTIILIIPLALGISGYVFGNFLYPDCIFKIGAQIEAYENLLSLRKTFFWGIFITFILGLFSSVLANIIFSQKKHL